MSDWIAAIILGIVEGLTEFLPISSTGHLLVAENWLKAVQSWPDAQRELFTVVIQPGAVLAVVAVFYARLRDMAIHWREPKTLDYTLKLATAFIITGAGGFAMKHFGFRLGHTIAPIAWATFIGGVVILAIEYYRGSKPSSDYVTWLVAITVGGAQLLAAGCPGTSRSGACILFAMLVGMSRPAAAEFSFLVGIPTMLAAGALEIHSALKDSGHAHTNWGVVLVGAVVSAIVAFVVVQWLMRFVQNHSFKGFGWYRIVAGGALLILLYTNVIHDASEPKPAPVPHPAKAVAMQHSDSLSNSRN